MNARAQTTYSDFARLHAGLVEESPVVIRRRLADAITIYDNDDGYERERAIEAIAAGRAAYWTMATYHNQHALNAADRANGGASLADAVAKYPKPSHERLYDTLVPLNRKAVTDLSLAYAALGAWRDEPDLERRRVVNCKRRAA